MSDNQWQCQPQHGIYCDELDTLREENESLRLLETALYTQCDANLIRAETAEAKLENWYLTHKIGYCGKHEYQHLREDAGCPECLLETAEARVKELETHLDCAATTFRCVRLREAESKLSRYEQGVEGFVNGSSICIATKDFSAFLNRGQRVSVLILPEEDV